MMLDVDVKPQTNERHFRQKKRKDVDDVYAFLAFC